MNWSTIFDRIYDDYEKMLIIPVVMILVTLGVLGMSYTSNGEVLAKGIDFTGGTSIQVQVPATTDTVTIEGAFPGATVRTMSGAGQDARWIIIETQETFDQTNTDVLQERLSQRLSDAGVETLSDISVQSLGSSVGSSFFQEAIMWAGIGLLIMSTVIFIAFRSVVPSLAVIFAAVVDVLFAMAGMSLLGIDLTLGSLAALLMLLGYSVDTDILLSTRVLRQEKGSLKDRINSSIITGSTMTFAAIAAFTALFAVSTAPTLDALAAVIIIGLVADLPVTWFGNAIVLKKYVEGSLPGGFKP